MVEPMLPLPDVPRLDFTTRISRSISADRFCCLLPADSIH
jgi:hypothetical protein